MIFLPRVEQFWIFGNGLPKTNSGSGVPVVVEQVEVVGVGERGGF